MALLALINDVALGQPIFPAAVQAAWAVLTDDPGDGSLVQDIGWRALGVQGGSEHLQALARDRTPPPHSPDTTQDVCLCAFQIHTGTRVYHCIRVHTHAASKGKAEGIPWRSSS